MRKKAKTKRTEVFTFDTRDITRVQRKILNLRDNGNLILSRAVNNSISNLKKNMRMTVSDIYRVQSGRVGKTLRVSRLASAADPTAAIRSSGRHITLSSYGFSPKRNAIKRKQGKYSPPAYKAAVFNKKYGGSLQRLDGNPKPFMQRVKHGNYISVRRASDDPQEKKLEAVYGPAVPQLLKNKDVLYRINRESEKFVSKQVINYLDQTMKRR